MSCNFLTSLILSHREIPVEYRLMTCLPKALPVFSTFSFSSRCLYLAYVLLIISSFALSTVLCVHLCPSQPLSMILFNSSRFLCCSVASFSVLTTSLKNSLFNTSPTLAIIFIKRRNCQHMKNDIRYKGTNNTSVIIFLIRSWLSKTPSDGTCLREPPGRFCDVGCCCFWPHWRFFISLLFDVIPHPSVDYHWVFAPILYSQSSPSQIDSGHFHFNFSRLFNFTASGTVLSERFLPTGVFYPTVLPLWLRCGQEHPIHNLPLCLLLQSCPFRLGHGLELLMFELQDLWFINCASEPRSIESKSNYWICFACSESYEKTIKTLWTRLDVLLITTSVNIKVILSIIENNRCLTDTRCF